MNKMGLQLDLHVSHNFLIALFSDFRDGGIRAVLALGQAIKQKQTNSSNSKNVTNLPGNTFLVWNVFL